MVTLAKISNYQLTLQKSQDDSNKFFCTLNMRCLGKPAKKNMSWTEAAKFSNKDQSWRHLKIPFTLVPEGRKFCQILSVIKF